MNDLKEELTLKTEQLNAKTIENNKRNEEMEQLRFALSEMKAARMDIQMLQKEVFFFLN